MAPGDKLRGRSRRKRWRARSLGLAFLWAAVSPLHAQWPAADLQEVEAAYILKFATYVQWPSHVFRHPAAPLVVGVMSDLDLARALEQTTRDRRINGRPVQVRFMGVDDQARGLHVLVLPQANTPARRRVLRQVAAQPVLTIAPPDTVVPTERIQAMVQMVLEQDRLRFDVAMPGRDAGLRISALMLTAARRVDNGVPE